MPPDVGVVVVAAGRGERCGSELPKQFRPLAGVPLLLHALRPFLSHPQVAQVIAVLPAAYVEQPPEWLAGLLGERLQVVAGGDSRMDSVEAGLKGLPASCTVVLVHDGARPFPDAAVITAVIAAARSGRGAIAAVPISDTLKEAGPVEERLPAPILRTVSRAALWRAQTPQGFPRALLLDAFAAARAASVQGTDEAELVEQAGGRVVLIPDVSSNIKVTTPADLELADALARARR